VRIAGLHRRRAGHESAANTASRAAPASLGWRTPPDGAASSATEAEQSRILTGNGGEADEPGRWPALWTTTSESDLLDAECSAARS
jgi:hypothetical protein